MTYCLHRGAEADLLEAARFYRQEGGSKLANRFLDEFERVAKLLVEFPGIGMPADDLRRVHPLHDFPYSVIETSAAKFASWWYAGTFATRSTVKRGASSPRMR